MLLDEDIQVEDRRNGCSIVIYVTLVLLFIDFMIVSSGNGGDKEINFDM